MKQNVNYGSEQPAVQLFRRKGITDVIVNRFVETTTDEDGNAVYIYEMNAFQTSPNITEEYIKKHFDYFLNLGIEGVYRIPIKDRVELIADSKLKLAAYLEENPLLWVDGKKYNVTAEKQALLTSQLSLYAMAVQAGAQTDLHWNATGEECQIWQYADLCALAMAIGAYVQPLVSAQQAYETAVMTAESEEKANELVFALG